MNISVVVCSINRAAILHDTVLSIVGQIHKPVEILIVSPGPQHILQDTRTLPGVRCILSPPGLPTQRNAGLACISPDSDLVAFFDDDIELSKFYLANIDRLFAENSHILIASGRLLYDGGRHAVVTREQAQELCCDHDRVNAHRVETGHYISTNSAYGCNMIVRHTASRHVRFDERLPLYAWLEDRDYSHRVTRNLHSPVESQEAVAVHLGSRSGRIGGVGMGFAEIVNPLYLWRKNRTFSLHYLVIQYWIRCLVGNVLGILKRDTEYDRMGLCKGNLFGLGHLLTGSCDPGHVTKLVL